MQKLRFLSPEETNPIWSKDEIAQIQNALNKKYRIFLKNEIFVLTAGYTKVQLQLRVTLRSLSKETQALESEYPVECVFVLNAEETSAQNIALQMLDYLDTYWDSFFKGERNVFVPLDWAKHEYEDLVFYMRGFMRNLSLEEQAEALLAKHGHGEYEIHPISSEL